MARIVSATSPRGRKLVTQTLEALRREFEQGDEIALLTAVAHIVIWSAPEWVRESWIRRFNDWRTYRKPTLDAAFDVVKRRKPKTARHKREAWRCKLVYDIIRLEDGVPRAVVFEAFARDHNESVDVVAQVHAGKVSRPWGERLGAAVDLLTNGMSRRQAFRVYANENGVSRNWVESVFYESASDVWRKIFGA